MGLSSGEVGWWIRKGRAASESPVTTRKTTSVHLKVPEVRSHEVSRERNTKSWNTDDADIFGGVLLDDVVSKAPVEERQWVLCVELNFESWTKLLFGAKNEETQGNLVELVFLLSLQNDPSDRSSFLKLIAFQSFLYGFDSLN